MHARLRTCQRAGDLNSSWQHCTCCSTYLIASMLLEMILGSFFAIVRCDLESVWDHAKCEGNLEGNALFCHGGGGDLTRYRILLPRPVPSATHGSSALTTAAMNSGFRSSPIGLSNSLSGAMSTSSSEKRPGSPTPSVGSSWFIIFKRYAR